MMGRRGNLTLLVCKGTLLGVAIFPHQAQPTNSFMAPEDQLHGPGQAEPLSGEGPCLLLERGSAIGGLEVSTSMWSLGERASV